MIQVVDAVLVCPFCKKLIRLMPNKARYYCFTCKRVFLFDKEGKLKTRAIKKRREAR